MYKLVQWNNLTSLTCVVESVSRYTNMDFFEQAQVPLKIRGVFVLLCVLEFVWTYNAFVRAKQSVFVSRWLSEALINEDMKWLISGVVCQYHHHLCKPSDKQRFRKHQILIISGIQWHLTSPF